MEFVVGSLWPLMPTLLHARIVPGSVFAPREDPPFPRNAEIVLSDGGEIVKGPV